jgi:hypothetical protein
LKSEDTVYSLVLLIQIGVKNRGQLMQTNNSWLLPLRRSMEKWIAQSQSSEGVWGKMFGMEESLFLWRIVVENLDRIDEAMKSIMSP